MAKKYEIVWEIKKEIKMVKVWTKKMVNLFIELLH